MLKRAVMISCIVVITIIVYILTISVQDWYVNEKLGNDFLLIVDNRNYVVIDYRDKIDNYEYHVIPPKVIEYNYNSKWIIAKSHEIEIDSMHYWIVNKNINLKSNKNNKSKILKTAIIGPLDSISFYKKLKELDIFINFKKVRAE